MINRHEAPAFMALGDSYTIGEGVTPAERWPVQLAAALKEAGFPVQEPQIIAQTGWTTSDLLTALLFPIPPGPYALVALQIGVNDQYQGLPLAVYQRNFDQLLSRAIEFTGGSPDRVIVISIPDWSVTPFAEGRTRARLSREIDAFNLVNKKWQGEKQARYVDITPLSRGAKHNPDLLAADGLHPSGLMYRQWVELILPHASAALATPRHAV